MDGEYLKRGAEKNETKKRGGTASAVAGMVPEDMAAAVTNRPSNHAHQTDAAAAIDEVDAPPHLHVAVAASGGKRQGHDGQVTYQARAQRKKETKRGRRWQCRSAWRAWSAELSSLTFLPLPARTCTLTSSWPSSRAASAYTLRRPALLPQKTQTVRNLLGTAASPSPMPIARRPRTYAAA